MNEKVRNVLKLFSDKCRIIFLDVLMRAGIEKNSITSECFIMLPRINFSIQKIFYVCGPRTFSKEIYYEIYFLKIMVRIVVQKQSLVIKTLRYSQVYIFY